MTTFYRLVNSFMNGSNYRLVSLSIASRLKIFVTRLANPLRPMRRAKSPITRVINFASPNSMALATPERFSYAEFASSVPEQGRQIDFSMQPLLGLNLNNPLSYSCAKPPNQSLNELEISSLSGES